VRSCGGEGVIIGLPSQKNSEHHGPSSYHSPLTTYHFNVNSFRIKPNLKLIMFIWNLKDFTTFKMFTIVFSWQTSFSFKLIDKSFRLKVFSIFKIVFNWQTSLLLHFWDSFPLHCTCGITRTCRYSNFISVITCISKQTAFQYKTVFFKSLFQSKHIFPNHHFSTKHSYSMKNMFFQRWKIEEFFFLFSQSALLSMLSAIAFRQISK